MGTAESNAGESNAGESNAGDSGTGDSGTGDSGTGDSRPGHGPGGVDHYRALGLRRGADPIEIRAAHRRLVKLLHPDRLADGGGVEARLAQRRLREVTRAWEVLGSPQERAAYDEELATVEARNGGSEDGREGDPRARVNPFAADAARTWSDSGGHGGVVGVGDDGPAVPRAFDLLVKGLAVVFTLIVVVTAYLGGVAEDPGVRPAVIDIKATGCVLGTNPVRCSALHDGRLVPAQGGGCPVGTEPMTSGVCVDRR